MAILIDGLVLLLVLALSAPLGQRTGLPLPLVQIALGVASAMAGFHVRLVPETFLLLFIPPLLFGDAFLIPKRELAALRGPILAQALGLVVFTTVVCGFAVHAVLPGVPLAACFALAAILSPTDAVAVGGLIRRTGAPRQLLHFLEGEALLNDATGLVCFKFAVAAAITGSFSLGQAAAAFLVVSLLGLAVGAVVAVLFDAAARLLLRDSDEEGAARTVLTLLLPFAAYLTAENAEASGILAAVSAGLVAARLGQHRRGDGRSRMRASSFWEMLVFVFNGMVFLLLGLQLPEVLRAGIALAHRVGRSPWLLPLFVLGLTLLLAALRFVWVLLLASLRRTIARLRERPMPPFSLAGIGASAVGGVRGALTLAGVLSLPVGEDGHGFPARNLLVVLAAGTILGSLVLASLTLPPLLRRLAASVPPEAESEVGRVRRRLVEAALGEIETRAAHETAASDPARRAACATVREELARRLLAEEDEEIPDAALLREMRMELALRLHALRAEREALTALGREHAIGDEAERELLHELDLREETLRAEAGRWPHDPEEV